MSIPKHGRTADTAEARLATLEYIEGCGPPMWYNRRRQHSSLNYRTPA